MLSTNQLQYTTAPSCTTNVGLLLCLVDINNSIGPKIDGLFSRRIVLLESFPPSSCSNHPYRDTGHTTVVPMKRRMAIDSKDLQNLQAKIRVE